MKFAESYSHHSGADEWKKRDLFDWLTDIVEAPSINIAPGVTSNIRDHIHGELEKEKWVIKAPIDPDANLYVFSRKDDLVIQLQTGNISRYAYDILKIQHLYSKKEIETAALIVPSSPAATLIGSNIANFDRISNELSIFDRVITVPLYVFSFE